MKKKNVLTYLLAVVLSLNAGVFAGENPGGQQGGEQDQQGGSSGDDDIEMEGPRAEPGKIIKIQRSSKKSDVNTFVAKAFKLKNAPAGDVAPIVENVVSAEGGSVQSIGSTNQIIVTCPPHMLPSVEQVIKKLDRRGTAYVDGLERFTYRPKHRSAAAVARSIEASFPGVDAYADSETNMVIFKCAPSQKADILRMLGVGVDVTPPQVQLEVKVVTGTRQQFTNLGPDWNAWKRHLSGGITVSRASGRANIPGATYKFKSAGTGAVISLDAQVLTELLNYTVQNTKDFSVVTKTITASNNNPASIQDLSAGEHASLSVVPTIGAETVNVTVSSAVGGTATTSSVSLKDGETAVLGGVSRKRSIESSGTEGNLSDKSSYYSVVVISAKFLKPGESNVTDAQRKLLKETEEAVNKDIEWK